MKSTICLLIIALTYLACWRTEFFSLDAIRAPLSFHRFEDPSREVERSLNQPYHYLAQGRQSYVFLSEDGQTVVKFFKKKYLDVPWYAKWRSGEKKKRELRQKYYQAGYSLALQEDAAILYLHLGKSDKKLPSLKVTDRASRFFTIDLNEVPFVVQRKGELFYQGLEKIYHLEGEKGVGLAVEQFVLLIGHRIEKKIADGDHDVEHNFGIIDGKVFHVDPGRLVYKDNLWEAEVLGREWWSATHQFREWLAQNHPQSISVLDEAIDRFTRRISSWKNM